MKIQPIVEGHGEVHAVPVLLRRLRDLAEAYKLDVNAPIRRNRSDLADESRLRLAIRIALEMPDCHSILIVLDADDDCPKELAPQLQGWASAEAGAVPCFVVIANREFEAWLLAAIESLRGLRGIRADAAIHPNPESPRDAKGRLTVRMGSGRSYSPAVDQAALTACFDMPIAYSGSRSFRRLVRVFGLILETSGLLDRQWPPDSWPSL